MNATDPTVLSVDMCEPGSLDSTFYEKVVLKRMMEDFIIRMVNKDEHRTHGRASSTKKGNDSVV